MVYRRRLIDDELDALLPELPAIGVDGPKGVGKTATGLQRATTVLSLDDPVALSVVRADPVRALGRPRPILIDEWQRAPEVWDHVRRAVDDGAPAARSERSADLVQAMPAIRVQHRHVDMGGLIHAAHVS